MALWIYVVSGIIIGGGRATRLAMAAELSVSSLRKRRALRRARIVAFLQSLTIFLLLVSMSEEYSHNQYMQAWMSQHFGGFGVLLNGSLAAFYAGFVIVYYFGEHSRRTVVPRSAKKEEIIVSA